MTFPPHRYAQERASKQEGPARTAGQLFRALTAAAKALSGRRVQNALPKVLPHLRQARGRALSAVLFAALQGRRPQSLVHGRLRGPGGGISRRLRRAGTNAPPRTNE